MIRRKTPLKRSMKPLKRSTKPIARRSRPARIRRTAAGQAKYKADREWSKAVLAKGPCVAQNRVLSGAWTAKINQPGVTITINGDGPFLHQCRGPIDPAHVMSRTFPATRTDKANGVPLCREAHDHFTRNPIEWELFCRSLLGDAEYDRLYAKAHGNKDNETRTP